jgi:phage-related protein
MMLSSQRAAAANDCNWLARAAAVGQHGRVVYDDDDDDDYGGGGVELLNE